MDRKMKLAYKVSKQESYNIRYRRITTILSNAMMFMHLNRPDGTNPACQLLNLQCLKRGRGMFH